MTKAKSIVNPEAGGQFPVSQAADDPFEHSVVSDRTWTTLASNYSTEQMMDAVFTVGQYNRVSRALNSFGVPPDDFLPGAKAGGAQLRISPPARRRR